MTPGENLSRIRRKLAGGGTLFLVDSTGKIHELTLEQYAAIPSAQLHKSRVCLTKEAADEYAAQVRAGLTGE